MAPRRGAGDARSARLSRGSAARGVASKAKCTEFQSGIPGGGKSTFVVCAVADGDDDKETASSL